MRPTTKRLTNMTTPDRDAPAAVRATSGVRIRPFRAGDAEPLYAAVQASRKALSAWLAWAQGSYTRADAEAWAASRAEAWTSGEAYSFLIERADDDRVLGGVGLNQVHDAPPMANLGYWVRTDATGRGVATTAARLAAQFGFEALDLQRIEITVPIGHAASARVAEKLGARREGVLRHRIRLHDRPAGAVLFGLLPGDL